MSGAPPLANQNRARSELACWHSRSGTAGFLGDSLEQSTRRSLNAAQCALLDTIGDCASQQVFADAGRRFDPVKSPPSVFQLFRAQSGKPGEFAAEFVRLNM